MKLINTIPVTTLLSSGGIFKAISNITGQPFEWLTNDFALWLDKDYYLIHSSEKEISKAYERFIELQEDGKIVSALNEIANIIIGKYALTWNKIYTAITTDYEPLENYNMEQVETPDITHQRDSSENSNISTVSSGSNDNSTHGFNSSTAVDTDSITLGTTVTVSGDEDDNNRSETETETGTRTTTRHGNIGVTTSQQMLQSEIDLRNNFNFLNQIMDDVDSILCLLTY